MNEQNVADILKIALDTADNKYGYTESYNELKARVNTLIQTLECQFKNKK